MRVLAVVICFVFIMAAPSIVNAQPKALERPIEFILLLDGSGSLTDVDFDKLVDLIRKWPDHFLISEQDSRVAVIQFSKDAKIELRLTGNETLVRSLSCKRMNDDTYTSKALRIAKEKVFSSARDGALKVVVIITDGAPLRVDKPATKTAADEVRQAGAETYVLFIGEQYKRPEIKQYIDNDLAGSSDHAYHVDDFEKLAEKFIEKFRKLIGCAYDETCQFNGETTCESVWMRRTSTEDGNCANKPPNQSKEKCDTVKCTEKCDKWTWEDVDCDSNPGKKVAMKREGSMPEEHKTVFEKCPKQKEVVCPGSDNSTTEKNNAARDPNKEETSDNGKGGLEWWWVIVIVVVIVCVLIIIVVVAVVISRKKKRAKQAKGKADLEKAAKMTKSKDGDPGISTPYDRSAKTVERNVGVSLRDKRRGNSVQRKKSTSAGKKASESKGPSSKSSKSMSKSGDKKSKPIGKKK